MNEDMETELEKIRNGKTPAEPYVMVLCPDTALDATAATLLPSLNGVVFTCGPEGQNTGCVISGGSNQVLINELENPPAEYELNMVNFIGVTFQGFTGSSISGSAGSETTVNFLQATFQDFDATFAIQQQSEDGGKPFRVELQESQVISADGGVALSNVGGELSLEGVVVDSSILVSVVSTGTSLNGDEGSTFIQDVTVTQSDITDIFVVMEAADIDAMGVNVNNMQNMGTVFDIVGEGSGLMLEDLVITENDLTSVDPQPRWIGVRLTNGATGMVVGATLNGNTNIRHAFSVAGGSSMELTRLFISDASGGRAVEPADVSAVVFANDDAQVTINRMVTEDIRSFTVSDIQGIGHKMG
jgi:hypothetical protein